MIPKNPSVRIFGLCGPSGAGKNVAAEILAQKGMHIIDADIVAREALLLIKESVIKTFSEQMHLAGLPLQHEDGTINRKNLGHFVFSDSNRLIQYEDLILPKIVELIEKDIEQSIIQHKNRPIVLNAPTLHKTKLLDICEFILYIDAPLFIRAWRCMKRDKTALLPILRRFSQQNNFFSQYILKNADIVRVKNTGRIKKLQKKLNGILLQRGFGA